MAYDCFNLNCTLVKEAALDSALMHDNQQKTLKAIAETLHQENSNLAAKIEKLTARVNELEMKG